MGGSSVATGSPSQTDFIKTGQWTRACWKRLLLVTSRQACEHRWHARRSEAVACNLGSCGRRRCRIWMRHAIVATTILSRFVSYMFCTFISQYMLDVEFGIEKRRGYICIYICRFCNRGARKIYVFIYVYVYMSRGLHISYLIIYVYVYMSRGLHISYLIARW